MQQCISVLFVQHSEGFTPIETLTWIKKKGEAIQIRCCEIQKVENLYDAQKYKYAPLVKIKSVVLKS